MNTNAQLTKEQVIASLQFFSNEDLIEINKALIGIGRAKQRGTVTARDVQRATIKASLSKGDNVQWTSTRYAPGQVLKGTVEKIKPKNVLVKLEKPINGETHLNVPATMLTKA